MTPEMGVDIEQMLRLALAPVDPPETLKERVESTLQDLTYAAVDELEGWELSSMRDPRIASTICGVTKPERVQETLDWAAAPIPDAAWKDLSALPFGTDDPEATRDYKLG